MTCCTKITKIFVGNVLRHVNYGLHFVRYFLETLALIEDLRLRGNSTGPIRYVGRHDANYRCGVNSKEAKWIVQLE